MACSPEIRKMFAQLQAQPPNKVCVDCTSRIPQWASTTYGTYMCLECSGIHRSMGVHISFVQSVTMDSWKNARYVAKMKGGGNGAFNDFLAAHGVPEKGERSRALLSCAVAGRATPAMTTRCDGRCDGAAPFFAPRTASSCARCSSLSSAGGVVVPEPDHSIRGAREPCGQPRGASRRGLPAASTLNVS